MSPKLLRSLPFKFLRWKSGIDLEAPDVDNRLERWMLEQLDGCPALDAVVVLAFDAVHDKDGRRDEANTHLFVENDYVADLARRHPKILFGASIHPYRPDALEELERCVKNGAVLVKWLPITQGIDPSDRRCFAFYDALAHYRVPLLSHTGGETMLPNVNKHADPTLLMPALRRGVTVIAAHCGTRSTFWESDYLTQWCKMAREHEHFYGDTSALSLPTRSHAYRTVLKDPLLRSKLVHGSDWPVMPVPPGTLIGARETMELLSEEPNWFRRDVKIKQLLGFDDDYWHRASKILRLPQPSAALSGR